LHPCRAIELFAKATELGNRTAMIRLGALYQSVGKYAESIYTLEKLSPARYDCSSALPLLLRAYYALCKTVPRGILRTLSETNLWWARQRCGAEARGANDDPEEVENSRELYEGRWREKETSGPIRTGKNCERPEVNIPSYEHGNV
jgi:TPR repeat protein